MGWNDRLEDSELSNLPPEAFGNLFDVDGPFDPNDHWLKGAERYDQRIAMREWFLARYCDPAQETPYISSEGGYIFVDGGPYDPDEELQARFGGIVDDGLIQELVADLLLEVGDQWAPGRRGPPDDYDERFGLQLYARNEPLQRLQERLLQSRQVLTLQGDVAAKTLAEKLVFSAAISALESFLWETAHYWIENDAKALRDFVTKLQVFKEEPMKLGDIFTRQEGLKDHVKAYLQNLIWHRWDKVVPLFRDGLGVKLPSLKQFDGALTKRHDIVHRSGHDKDGSPIVVTATEIQDLCATIESFAVEVDRLLSARGSEGLTDGADTVDF